MLQFSWFMFLAFLLLPDTDFLHLQIIFHYVGYNETGRRIDSTYIQGSPAKIRLGNGTLVPGKYSLSR